METYLSCGVSSAAPWKEAIPSHVRQHLHSTSRMGDVSASTRTFDRNRGRPSPAVVFFRVPHQTVLFLTSTSTCGTRPCPVGSVPVGLPSTSRSHSTTGCTCQLPDVPVNYLTYQLGCLESERPFVCLAQPHGGRRRRIRIRIAPAPLPGKPRYDPMYVRDHRKGVVGILCGFDERQLYGGIARLRLHLELGPRSVLLPGRVVTDDSIIQNRLV